MKKYMPRMLLIVSLLCSLSATADDLIAYLIAKAPSQNSTETLQKIKSVGLSNCLQLASMEFDVISVRVHCNEMDDLQNALINDIYPLLGVHLKAQWIEVEN